MTVTSFYDVFHEMMVVIQLVKIFHAIWGPNIEYRTVFELHESSPNAI